MPAAREHGKPRIAREIRITARSLAQHEAAARRHDEPHVRTARAQTGVRRNFVRCHGTRASASEGTVSMRTTLHADAGTCSHRVANVRSTLSRWRAARSTSRCAFGPRFAIVSPRAARFSTTTRGGVTSEVAGRRVRIRIPSCRWDPIRTHEDGRIRTMTLPLRRVALRRCIAVEAKSRMEPSRRVTSAMGTVGSPSLSPDLRRRGSPGPRRSAFRSHGPRHPRTPWAGDTHVR